MALPPGFELEQPAQPALKLPPGFELEPTAAPSEIPAPRRAASPMAALGRTAASLADVTIGGLIPGAVQYGAYPILRATGQTPEQATAATRRMVEQVDQPFGKAFGVAGTPEYEQEASRRLMAFVGENFQKGAKWIADKVGLPQSDVESIMATSTFAAPKVGAAVSKVAAPAVQQARMGAELVAEPLLQARRERLSAESYARGPQIDAAKEAQRLNIALNPADVQPSATSRLLTTAAGERGQQAIVDTNKTRVREVVLKELGLPKTTQLDAKSKAFDTARAQVAKPYEEVSKLPKMVADDQLVARLESLRADPNIIGSKEFAPAIDRIVDSAIAQTRAGLTGDQLLKNVRVLRERARKTYDQRSATIEALDIADTNLAVANALESMIESNIFNPRLLSEFRDARQKMARAYAYEGATNLNTGVVDVSKLARITAKDSMLTGDIASLGRIAGNFPDAFSAGVASPWQTAVRLGRTGAAGTLGGVAGYLAGQDYMSAVLGTIAGATAGRGVEAAAARIISSPGYQSGLRVPDYRLPVNQLAATVAPIPQDRAIVPYQPEVLGPSGTSAAPLLRVIGYDENGRPIYKPTEARAGFTTPPQPEFGVRPTVMEAQRGLPNEVPRQIYEAQKRAELAQEFRAAAERKPASGEVILDFDPVTGRLREASQGIKGATPETFRNFGADLESAAQKVTAGKRFDLTAAEKVAWERTKVDLAEVAPGMKALSDKAVAEKMMDRAWVNDAIKKARDKAEAFAQIEAKAKDAAAKRKAAADRERMLDLLESLEEQFRMARPVQGTGQGPKTRAAQRNQLRPAEPVNKLILPD